MTWHRDRPGFVRAAAICAMVAGLSAVAVPAAGAATASARAHTDAGAGPGAWRQLSWRLLDTGTQTHFRGLSVVSERVAWLGGYDGVVLRTVNGGRSWIDASPAGASALQFRDIEAFSATRAVAMAAGTGTASRLYVTADGGRSWRLSYKNTNPQAFFDCMAFFNHRQGLVLSDPVNGKFRILSTRDGGRDWRVLPSAGMPHALP